jgi:hypothetical protein
MPITNDGIVAAGQLAATKGTLFTADKLGHYYISLGNTDAATQGVTIYLKKLGGTSRIIYSGLLAVTKTAGASQELPTRRNGYLLAVGDLIEGEAATAAKVDYTIERAGDS